MLPPPPDLSDAIRQWKERELFWIIKHGIKYTGMPAWVSQQRDDEVWAVVAFLKQLPTLDAQSYRDLAFGDLRIAPPSGRELALAETGSELTGACARCHGADDRGPASGLVPVLHGQPVEFLVAALHAYADGKRESGIMQPVAADLTPHGDAARGGILFALGAAAEPCQRRGGQRCHRARQDTGKRGRCERQGPAMPDLSQQRGPRGLSTPERTAFGLHGRPAAAMEDGFAANTETDTIMRPIARLLSDRQIDEVSAYFADAAAASSDKAQPR